MRRWEYFGYVWAAALAVIGALWLAREILQAVGWWVW